VDYFADEKEAQKAKGKPKGTMALSGYHVVEDIGDKLLKQGKELAEKMGVDFSELPKPKKYPEHCFEVAHERRRCYYIECADADEKKEWIQMFRTVCRNAYGLNNQDPVHKRAFHHAVRDTRWELGRWGWWSYGGSEEQILSDIISDEIEYQTLGKIYSKITGPWAIRSKIRNQVLKTLDTLVGAGVKPAWGAMAKAVEELRPKIEPTIKQLAEPLAKEKINIMEKMKEACMSIINPITEKNVTPHLGSITSVIKAPVTDSWDKVYELFEQQVAKYAEKADLSKPDVGFKDMDWFARSWWSLRPATEKLDVMYEPLYLLREVFSNIYPWWSIWKGQDQLRKKMDNAVYTFQIKLKKFIEEDKETAIEKAKVSTMKKLKKDAKTHTRLFYVEIIKDIIMPPFEGLVLPACKSVLEPLNSMIPEPMKQFIDLIDMFVKMVNMIIDEIIANVLGM